MSEELIRLSDFQEHGPKPGRLPIPRRGTNAWKILNAIAAAAAQDQGLLDIETIDQLKMHGSGLEATVRSCRAKDLVRTGWVVDAGQKRKGLTGTPSTVWFLSEAGAQQYGLPRGWRAVRRKAKRNTIKQGMSPEEQLKRREQQAIERARGMSSKSFISYSQRLQREVQTYTDLRNLAENRHCPPHEREILLMFARHIHDITGGVIAALERNEPLEMGYYELLGVGHQATDRQITMAYRKLAKQHHPDTNPDDMEIFKEITTAYDVLSDQDKRLRYNLYGPTLEARRK